MEISYDELNNQIRKNIFYVYQQAEQQKRDIVNTIKSNPEFKDNGFVNMLGVNNLDEVSIEPREGYLVVYLTKFLSDGNLFRTTEYFPYSFFK